MRFHDIFKLFDGTIQRIVIIAECPLPELGLSSGQFVSIFTSDMQTNKYAFLLDMTVVAIGSANGLYTFNVTRN